MGWFNHQLATNNFTIVRNFKFQIIIVFRVHVCQPAWVNGSWSHQITFIFMASQPTFPLRNKALIRAYYPIRPYQNLKSHYFWGGRLTSHNIWTSLHKKWLCSGNPLIAFYWKVMRVGDRNISVDSSLLPLMFCCDLAMKEVFSMAPFFVEDDLTDHLPYLCIKKPVTSDDVVKDAYDLCFFDRNILAILGVSLRLLNKYIIYLFRTLFNRWKLGGGLCFLFKLVLCLVCNPNTFLLLWEPKGVLPPNATPPRKNHYFDWGCWLSPSSWRLPSKCWHLCMWPFLAMKKQQKQIFLVNVKMV